MAQSLVKDRKDGKIQIEHMYGQDPNPPKGMRAALKRHVALRHVALAGFAREQRESVGSACCAPLADELSEIRRRTRVRFGRCVCLQRI